MSHVVSTGCWKLSFNDTNKSSHEISLLGLKESIHPRLIHYENTTNILQTTIYKNQYAVHTSYTIKKDNRNSGYNTYCLQHTVSVVIYGIPQQSMQNSLS